MKLFLLVLAFSLSVVTSAQSDNYSLQVNYKMETYFSSRKVYDCELLCNNSNSIFRYKRINAKEHGIEAKEDNKFYFEVEDTNTYYIQSHKKKDSLFELKKMLKSVYLVEEKYPNIKWSITSDTATISHYQCYKATTSFRGRDYVAWFTTEIPCSFGPWKLHGLPGLILMVNDLTNEVVITAKSIQTVDKVQSVYVPKNIKRIERHRYRSILQKEIQELKSKLSSKAERGYEIKMSTSTIKDIEIE